MAAKKYLDKDGLLYLWGQIKAKLALKADAQSVTADSYGPSADVSPAHGGTFKVPYVQVTSQGVVTAISEKTITLPASGNTDTKVKQNLKGTSDTGKYPIVLKNSTTATDSPTGEVNYVAAITVQPSTGTVEATKFKGAVTGNADTATEFASAQTVALTGDVTGSTSSTAGWSVATTLSNSGVSAGSYGPSTNATPAYGATFDVPYITVDAKGRVTAASTKTVQIPAADNTDTLMTQNVSTNNATYPLLLCPTADASANQGAKTGIFASGILANPSTNNLMLSGAGPKYTAKQTDVTRNTAPSADNFTLMVQMLDSANVTMSGIETVYKTDKTNGIRFICYKGTTTTYTDNVQVGCGYDGSGNWYTYAPTASVSDNSTKIATTAWARTATGNFACNAASASAVAWSGVTSKPTTVSGYGITDAYTKTEIDAKLTSAMHYKGSVATVGDLPSSNNQTGDFYNVTSTGENYAWDGSAWDVTGSIVDLAAITNSEIDTIVAS